MKRFIFAFFLIIFTSNSFALPIASIVIQDAGSADATGTDPGTWSPTLDGISGAFRFANINDTTYSGASPFYGDLAVAPGIAPGEIDPSQINPPSTFTTGFLFAGTPFVPQTTGPIVASLQVVGGNLSMSITSLPFAGTYGGAQVFILPPDSTPSSECSYPANNLFEALSVHWLHWIDATHVAFKIGWSHCITNAEDPSGNFVAFNAHWRLEGIAEVSGGVLPQPTTYTVGPPVPPAEILPEPANGLGGGCTISKNQNFDPLFMIMIFMAGLMVWRRCRITV